MGADIISALYWDKIYYRTSDNIDEKAYLAKSSHIYCAGWDNLIPKLYIGDPTVVFLGSFYFSSLL